MSRFEKNIITFDITMDDIEFIQFFECIDELSEYDYSFSLFKSSFISDKLFQRPSFTIFINQVNVIICFDHFNEADHIQVVLKEF